MLMRCTAAALVALTAACVTEMDEDENIDERRVPSAAFDTTVLEDIHYTSPAEPPPLPVNQRPVPGDDVLATIEDRPVTIRVESLLDNDLDPEGGRVVFVQLGADVDGVVSERDRVITFTPDADFTGLARFFYVVSDGRLMATGRVTVFVAPVNDAPVAYGDHIEVPAGEEVDFHLNWFDADADPLTIEIAETPAHGTLSEINGRYTYRPEPGWTGADRLVYRVADAEAWSELVDVELQTMPAH